MARQTTAVCLVAGALLLTPCRRSPAPGSTSPARVAVDAGGASASDAGGGVAIPPPPERAVWRWGPARRDDCTGEGLRQISAPLRNVPAGIEARDACARAPRNLMGIDFPAPDRCDGERGEWDVPDSTCAATPPPAPVRGADGPLLRPEPLEGYADLHVHQMGHLGFAGSVVWGGAFGPPAETLGPIPEAMKRGHDLSEALVDGDIVTGLVGLTSHDEHGYPSFARWPSRDLVTHQQAHEDWLFRAYQGGLRLMVMLAVNSEDMFGRGENDLGALGGVTIQGTRAPGRSSNDMEALEWQVREAYRMQDHVDARHGGPGRGWYRIVRDPDEASAAIARGQLAVVLGTELQHLFNCDSDRPACSEADVVAGLDRLEAMGVSYVFPIHHKLNQFGGPAQFNPLTNGPVEECHETNERCSAVGLTALGKFFMHELTARGLLIDTEHLSWRALDDALAIAEARGYPLLASHVQAFDLETAQQTEHIRRTDQLRRLFRTGGMVGIIQSAAADEYSPARGRPIKVPISCGGADRWANSYLYMRDLAGGGLIGAGGQVTIGSDWNGFASWPAPRFGSPACEARTARDGRPIPKPAPVSYPLPLPPGLVPAAVGARTSLDAMTAPRAWDYNREGLMHAGLEPEFLEDLRLVGLSLADLEPLYRSARGLVELWRRARDRVVPGDRHRLRWVPASAFDLLPAAPRDPSRDVEVAPGFAICRTRADGRLGFEQGGRCLPVEGDPPARDQRPGAITAYHAGRCLDVDGRSLRDGARLQQYTCNGGSNQQFVVRPVADGFELVVSASGKCIAPEEAAAGARVAQRPCDGGPAQRWQPVRSGNTFALRAGQLCLEVEDQRRADGAAVVLATCTGAAHQQWEIAALRAEDHLRLFQADKDRIRWAPAADGAFNLPVLAGERAICRAPALLGVVIGDECVGRSLDGTSTRRGGFERLWQTP